MIKVVILKKKNRGRKRKGMESERGDRDEGVIWVGERGDREGDGGSPVAGRK